MKYPCKIYKKIKDEVDIYNADVNDFCQRFNILFEICNILDYINILLSTWFLTCVLW